MNLRSLSIAGALPKVYCVEVAPSDIHLFEFDQSESLRACVRAGGWADGHACVRAGGRTGMRACVRACVRTYNLYKISLISHLIHDVPF